MSGFNNDSVSSLISGQGRYYSFAFDYSTYYNYVNPISVPLSLLSVSAKNWYGIPNIPFKFVLRAFSSIYTGNSISNIASTVKSTVGGGSGLNNRETINPTMIRKSVGAGTTCRNLI